jgi:hypothetical protein
VPIANPKRADPLSSYITSSGHTTTDKSLAAVFQLTSDGQLVADGLVESTDHLIDWQVFAGSPSDSVGPITRRFRSENGSLVWVNREFDGNRTAFYRSPKGMVDDAIVIARFRGPVGADWESIPMSVLGE